MYGDRFERWETNDFSGFKGFFQCTVMSMYVTILKAPRLRVVSARNTDIRLIAPRRVGAFYNFSFSRTFRHFEGCKSWHFLFRAVHFSLFNNSTPDQLRDIRRDGCKSGDEYSASRDLLHRPLFTRREITMITTFARTRFVRKSLSRTRFSSITHRFFFISQKAR